jgi:hypothetical protein
MNCSEVRVRLAGLLYGDLTSEEGAAVETHLTTCPLCRHERDGLEQVRSALSLSPVTAIHVDVSRLYLEAADRQARRLRRWRRAAVALAGVAAVLLLTVWFRLEVGFEGRQLVVRLGGSPAATDGQGPAREKQPAPPSLARRDPTAGAESLQERLQVMDELIHALSADMEQRDAQQQEKLTRLRDRLEALREQTHERLTQTERVVAALGAAQLSLTKGGE